MPDLANADPAFAGEEDGFHTLRIASIQREAGDSVSLILDIPPALKARFAYRAGQYVTLRVMLDGKRLSRCYSMSTAPETDPAMRITIKRVDDGRVSRWITESVQAGDRLEAMEPAGRFCLRRDEGALLLFAAGSGITPILSLAKAALAATARPVTMVYANQDRDRIIFAEELDALALAYPDRFRLVHWLDTERGLLDPAGLRALDVLEPGADFYICGPAPFMDVVEAVVLESGADREHVFVERFVSPPDEDEPPVVPPGAVAESALCETLTVTVHGQGHVVDYEAGETIVQAAFRAGLYLPVSCLSGSCATCMAKIVKGAVAMEANDVLTPSEVEQGYVLCCQGRPTAREVSVVFEG